jgi:GntP family gluconate:H+ symporter
MNLLAAVSPDYTPFWILAAGVVFVILSIVKFRLHPFLALTLGAVFVGILTPRLPDNFDKDQIKILEELRLQYDTADENGEKDGYFDAAEQKAMSVRDQERLTREHLRPDGSVNHWGKAVSLSMAGFGKLVGGIGFVIAMAAVIGMCMMESGAADKIVRRLMSSLGEDRAAWAMLISGFVLSIPVFFDTVFFLLIPLARALALRTGKNYTLYVCAIAGAGAITHTIVPPTPGPLMIAENLGQSAGAAIIAGLFAAIIPVVIVMCLAKRFNEKLDIPIRETRGSSLKELEEIVQKKDDELPGFSISLLPVVLPVVLIAMVTFIDFLGKLEGLNFNVPAGLMGVLEFVGNKNVAMFIAALIAMYTLAVQRGWTLNKLGESINSPLEVAGVIILITGAGGAFGTMIRETGIGETIENIGVSEGSTAVMLFMAWLLTAVIRAAQGSATVSMITGSTIMAPILTKMAENGSLGCHPIYFCLAIGFGAFPLSWMNDSGFWVVQRMSGFTEKETLKTWTVMLTAIGVVGIIQVIVMSSVLPLKPEKPKEAPSEKAQVSSIEALALLGNSQQQPRPQK